MAGYIGSKASVVSSGAERKQTYSITTTTTSLTGLAYTPTKVHVYHNGIRLVDTTDYTATDGTSITLTNAAESGDEVVVISYATFQTSDTVSAANGGTFAGQLNTTDILPSADDTSDLGSTSKRFQDFYLSGGVYLGGTGSANKLDDYETGTWTITDGSGAGLSFTVQDNVYTKAGRLVVASAIITWPSTSNTSPARIVLPFTSIANNSHSGGVVTEQNWNAAATLTASCNYTNGVIFRQRGGGSLTNANLSGKKLRFTVTYHAA